MAGPDRDARTWPLRGASRLWWRIAVAVSATLLAAGAALAVAALVAPGALPVLGPAAVLLGVGALVGSQAARCAVVVTLDRAGTLVLRRPLRTVCTRATRVRSARLSVLNRSGRRTPVVLRTADGSALLLHDRGEVAELLAEVRRHHPGVGAPF